MKKILSYAAVFSLVVAASSCSLEKFPETMYAENNTSGTGDAETAINTRELLEGQLTAMYNYMKGDFQNYWYQLSSSWPKAAPTTPTAARAKRRLWLSNRTRSTATTNSQPPCGTIR